MNKKALPRNRERAGGATDRKARPVCLEVGGTIREDEAAGEHHFVKRPSGVLLSYRIGAFLAAGAAAVAFVPVAFRTVIGEFVVFEDAGAALPAFGDIKSRVAGGALVKVFCAFNRCQAMTAFRTFVHFPPLPSEKAR